MVRSALVCIALMASAACTDKPHQLYGRWVDLSHDMAEDSPFWPTAEGFKHEIASYGKTPGGWFYSSYNLTLSEHGGTHLDAPVHFAEGAHSVDQIQVDRLIGRAVVIDVTAKAQADADYLVSVADIEAFEKAHGRIPDDTIVLLRTGYSSRWPDAARYLGTAERGADAVAKLHFPGLDPEAARFLVEQRRVRATGIDTASIDRGQSTTFETHRILSAANVPNFENLTALDRLPPTGAHVVALPMKIRGGSGGPLRAIAIVPGT